MSHRIRTTVTAGISLAALAVTVTACGSPASHRTAPPPARITASQAATTAPIAPTITAMDTWCAGTGYTDLQAVLADSNTLATDAGNSDLLAVEADGGQLTTDANAAEGTPPPVTNAQEGNYILAMAYTIAAGNDAAAGDITSATTAITTATGYISKDQGILPC